MVMHRFPVAFALAVVAAPVFAPASGNRADNFLSGKAKAVIDARP